MPENQDAQEPVEAHAGEAEKEREPEAQADSPKDEGEAEAQRADSKYRLIIVAAQRSKQLQRGTQPKASLDDTRDVQRGGGPDKAREIKALKEPSSIGIDKIRSAVEDVVRGRDS